MGVLVGSYLWGLWHLKPVGSHLMFLIKCVQLTAFPSGVSSVAALSLPRPVLALLSQCDGIVLFCPRSRLDAGT